MQGITLRIGSDSVPQSVKFVHYDLGPTLGRCPIGEPDEPHTLELPPAPAAMTSDQLASVTDRDIDGDRLDVRHLSQQLEFGWHVASDRKGVKTEKGSGAEKSKSEYGVSAPDPFSLALTPFPSPGEVD